MAGLDTVAVTMARTLRGLGRGGAAGRHRRLRRRARRGRRAPPLVRVLGRPRHAGAPPRGRPRLRPRLRGRVRGRSWDGDEPRAPSRRRSRCCSTPTRSRRRSDGAGRSRSTGRRSRCAGPTASSCGRRTSRGAAADELDEAHRLMGDLRLVGARRASRRQRPTSRRRGPIDVGATTRRALRTGGEPLRTVHRRAGDRPRRVVLLCDVSGSMEAYARALVRFAHVAVVGPRPGRGVHARHPLHPHHPRARVARPRRRARRGGRRGGGLVRRHPARARACARSTSGGGCAAWPAARWW